MRERVLTGLMGLAMLLPLTMIAVGGDVGRIGLELKGLWGAPFVASAFAQSAPLAPQFGAPALNEWGSVWLSVLLVLAGLWLVNQHAARRRRSQ